MLKFNSFFLIVACLFISSKASIHAQPPGYNFGKHVLINASQVSGTGNLLNFPVLFQTTDNDLRHISNGGSVENINGFDIVFFAGDCITPLNHELESYDPVSGSITAWVQVNAVSATTNTGIQMYYGNPSIATDQSTSTTWNAGYDGVWHLQNPTVDASGSGNNGVNNGSSNFSPGFIEDAQSFVDPNHWIELPSHNARGGSFSYTAWFNSSDVSRSGQRIICDDATNGQGCHAISLGDPGSGRIRFYIRNLGPVSLDSPNLISNNTWYYVSAVFDASTSTKYLYVNGNLVASQGVGGTLGPANGNASIGGEVAAGEAGNRFMGRIDEVRSFSGTLSPEWIETEYNNQSNPLAFYSIGAQLSAVDLCVLLPVELTHFSCKPNIDYVKLSWITVSEVNNDFFEIQRSKDGVHFENIGTIKGAGNSNMELHYTYEDQSPLSGISYYRLRQVDFDGAYEYSDIRSVTFNSIDSASKVFPNPSSGILHLKNMVDFVIYDAQGRVVKNYSLINSNDRETEINISQLQNGVYFISSGVNTIRLIKQ